MVSKQPRVRWRIPREGMVFVQAVKATQDRSLTSATVFGTGLFFHPGESRNGNHRFCLRSYKFAGVVERVAYYRSIAEAAKTPLRCNAFT